MKARDTIFTMKEWKGSFVDQINEIAFKDPQKIEIDEDLYDYFLNFMPPIYGAGCFLNSETYAHNQNGTPVFMAFERSNNRFYYRGLRTIKWAKGGN